MNPALAGLLSALFYGVGDFLSGLSGRHDAPLRIAALTHPIAALALLALALLLGAPLPPASDLWWGALAGAIGLGAVLAFYRGLALGPMGPVSVGAGALSAAVPVAFGVLGGEVLGALGWTGAAGILSGTVLLSLIPGGTGQGGVSAKDNGVLLGLVAGVGFGFYFVALGQAQSAAGLLWTLAAARLASSLIVVPIAALTMGLRPSRPALLLASAPGDTLGNLFYLMAVQGGGLALAGLLTSLYPALTTLLAVIVLRERLRASQWGGVVLALAGAALLTAG
ncbi:DMT family transporter [Deinococcus sp.]|uniref:DMT family transporter n=1 Tax=Deinococcus sp. TaxID=47478 RepID=UPI0025FD12D5|nr:DMT family transporter [Deinococcus sp.]